MTLLSPIWLLLAIPLGLSMWLWPLPTRVLTAMRVIVVALLLIGLAGVTIELPSRAGTVVVVADRSLSMPGDATRAELEAIGLVGNAMGAGDQLGVISFGRTAVTELAPQAAKFDRFIYDVGADASNLHAAMEQAVSLIPPQSPGRILLLTDGRWTGRDPTAVASRAAARNISIDYRLVERAVASDLAIEDVQAPPTVNPREAFMLTAWVASPTPQTVAYELKRGDQRLAAGRRTLTAGLNRLTFRDVVEEPTTAAYVLSVRGNELDPVPENNTAKVLIGVEGVKPVLHLTEKTDSQLAKLLRTGGLDMQVRHPDQAAWSLADLSGYSAVMIEEVGAGKIGLPGMTNLAEWVRQTGSGLMMTGGQTAFGPGGYFKSPLEPIMPVSMELRREHRKLSLAIVVALDRSGSMAMTTPSGRTKMDLADLAAAQVVDMLTPMDEFGVLAVDSAAHEIVPLAPLDNPGDVRQRILGIDSMGGGIFVFEALSNAARMLEKSKAGTRHIILFADAQDSEEPGQYVDLLKHARAAGITCSVIGLGKPTDVDAGLLRDVAARGDGRIFFTENPEELPRLFAQDTFVVARSSFIDEPTPVKVTPGLTTLTTKVYSDTTPPDIGGYNLTYLRDGANLSMVTTDEYAAPVLASWQAGRGRTLCYTGQVDGEFTGPIARWNEYGDTLTAMVRWTAGQRLDLPNNMVLTQRQDEGVVRVKLHLDPQREATGLDAMPNVSILRGRPGEKPEAADVTMTWLDADTVGVEFDLFGSETAIATVSFSGSAGGGHPPIALPAVTLPYSPEFKPVSTQRGPATLARLAAATSGIERLDLPAIWEALPKLPRRIDLSPFILSAALLMFLLEVLERRTGAVALVLTAGRVRRPTVIEEEPKPASKPAKVARKSRPQKPAKTPAEAAGVTVPEKDKPAPPPSTPQPTGSVMDALSQARRRANDRTRRSDD
ncbi:VWA domain-containing protein [Planctomycetales bacterium ZRK34]|nr:VWA domain-containing protein [Planctomycetales bacterium ZRK34]